MDKKIVKGTVLDINGLIDYAEDGIVSKEFEHSKGGSITLFAFDKGQKLEVQRHHPALGDLAHFLKLHGCQGNPGLPIIRVNILP